MFAMPIDEPEGPERNPDDLLPAREAAAVVGVPWTTMSGWLQRRRITKYRRGIGRDIYLSVAEVRSKWTIRPVR